MKTSTKGLLSLGLALSSMITPAAGLAGEPDVLTAANMSTLLRRTGLEVEEATKTECQVTVVKDTPTTKLKATLTVLLTKGGSDFWLTVTVKSNLPPNNQLSGEKLARLLEANEVIGPYHFSIDSKKRILRLNLLVANRPMTTEALRAKIEAFVEKIFSTQDLWGGDLT